MVNFGHYPGRNSGGNRVFSYYTAAQETPRLMNNKKRNFRGRETLKLYITTDLFAYVMLEASKGEAEASGAGNSGFANIYDVIYRGWIPVTRY
jgi:hypothetical protein